MTLFLYCKLQEYPSIFTSFIPGLFQEERRGFQHLIDPFFRILFCVQEHGNVIRYYYFCLIDVFHFMKRTVMSNSKQESQI